ELSPTEISALVARATEGRTKARRDLDRVRRLHNDSVATLTQLQDAATALEVAEQEVRGVEFNQSLSVIRAPAAGVILQRVAEPNAVVSPGATILTLRTERRGVILRAGLADRDAMRVRRGDPARITLDALPGEVLEGRVSQIAASASAQTGTFDVEIAISGSRRPLASGLIARAEIAVGASGTYAMLPLDAIVEASADSAVVFVVPDSADVAERRIVRLAQITGARAAVSSGIASGERVVVRGGAYLQDGSRVTIAAGKEPR
ncbi:MAG: efflux RND transporter periplasmic adaptor subunit, partial [Gemmatimonadaceae bacterium]